MADEFELIASCLKDLTPTGSAVRRGIGDDCAIVQVPAGHELAVSIDGLHEGIHFPAATAARDIGWKALACGLSDLAAAGADPEWCLLALGLPSGDRDWLAAFAEGFGTLAAEHGISLAGGDTTRSERITVTVQVAGHLPEGAGLTRVGARAGDLVCVSGAPGEAAAGLDQVLRGNDFDPYLRGRLDRPTPRVALGRWLRGRATACIDVSDGVAADCGHIAAASGLALRLEAERLPVSPALAAAAGDDARAREWVLHGGDDYELCFTLPADRAATLAPGAGCPVPVSVIGRVDAGSGVYLRDTDGRERALAAAGFRHFTP